MFQKLSLDGKVLLGCLSVFGSAFCFYLSTVVVKWAGFNGVEIDTASFVFFRFLLGFVTVVTLMGLKKKRPGVKKMSYLIGRTVSNCAAVYCFFKGVELTSVAQANILNMTYPIFIAVFSWIFFKEQRDITAVGIVVLAFIGVILILDTGRMNFHVDSLWALSSGVCAAVSIMYLNLSQKVHDTDTTLFILFGLGSLIMYLVFHNKIGIPGPLELKYLFFSSAAAISGQYLITIGFKYVTAIEGGIISSTRILLAALLGPLIAMDPSLSISGWAGAFLIFCGNVYLTLRKVKK